MRNGKIRQQIRAVIPRSRLKGKVIGSHGALLTAHLPIATLGAEVQVQRSDSSTMKGLITSLRGEQVTIAPFGSIQGIVSGSPIYSWGKVPALNIPHNPGGLVIDATGARLEDALSVPALSSAVTLFRPPPQALRRRPINTQLATGISALDAFVPIGQGQRLSLSAPAGTGKSTMLGMIIRNATVDHTVVALIGERGREVRDFLDLIGDTQTRARSTVVISTSDDPPMKKVLAAETAMSLCEMLRDQGKQVLLVMDSLTRLARAMRDLALAQGEIPVRQGYPASVLVALPALLERAGCDEHGSVTALFSMLQEESSLTDFLTHEVSSLLDGHIVLDTVLSSQGHYPAIDVTRSLSRLTTTLLNTEQQQQRLSVLKLLNRLYKDRDLLLLGGVPDAELEQALAEEHAINQMLRQEYREKRSLEQTRQLLHALAQWAPQ